MKKVVLKNFNIHRNTPVLESLLNKVGECWEIFKKIYFEEYLYKIFIKFSYPQFAA